jgi:hypothetical protein
MNTANYNIVCPQGATLTTTFAWTNNSSAVNLTSYSASMQVRDTYTSASPVLSIVSPTNITLGGSLGTIAISVPASTTAGLVAKNYVYDLELQYSGVVTRLVQGKFVVTPEVTR